MKIISARPDRQKNCNIYLHDREFTYKVEADYLQWPEGVKGKDGLSPFCDKDDNIYVCTNSIEHPICVFNPEGEFMYSFGQGLVDRPHSLFPTQSGGFLVADSGMLHHTVVEITTDNKLLRTFGQDGVPSDTGYDPYAFDKNKAAGMYTEAELKNFYLTYSDWMINQATITRVGKPFNRPTCMAQASTGEYFAADGYGNCAVHKFDKDGNYVKSWGGAGSDPGQFNLPHWLSIDKYDRIWVSDRENSRAHVYNTEGELLAMAEGGFYRIASITTSDKHIYLAGLRGGMTVLDIDTLDVVAEFGFENLNLLEMHGVCTNSKEDIFFTSIKGLRSVGNFIKLKRI